MFTQFLNKPTEYALNEGTIERSLSIIQSANASAPYSIESIIVILFKSVLAKARFPIVFRFGRLKDSMGNPSNSCVSIFSTILSFSLVFPL